jgi:hypothetical protein
MTRLTLRHRAAAPILLATLVLSACAPEATETAVPTPEPTIAPTVEAAAGGMGENPAFCASYPQVIEAFMATSLTESDEARAAMDKATIVTEGQKLADVIAPLATSAPAELKASIDLVSTALDKVLATGDATGFMNDEMMAQTTDVDLWAYENCGWAQVPVTATDYAFEGIPASLRSGMTAFKMDNKATEEYHVLLIVRRDPGSTATLEDLMAYHGDGLAPGFTLMGATGAAPGQPGVAMADLTPGSYVAICPIPQGGQPDGESHAKLGMISEFTVE